MATRTMDGHTVMDRSSMRTAGKSGTAIGHYARFLAMIGTSAVFMYAFMYLNTYVLEHVHWSMTRLYMTLIMTATMAVIMLTYMRSMYTNKAANLAIYALSAIVFIAALVFVRTQAFIQDRTWMKAMIPHHSIAILTSERATIEDARVKALSESIISSQSREIKEMEWLIQDINKNGVARTESEAAARPVPSF